MYGGAKGSGALHGNGDALKHGFTTRDANLFRKIVRLFIKRSRGIEG